MRKFLILLLLLTDLEVYSAVYYVSTIGNDNNSGTFTSPWFTWQKGFDVATAGDTVNILGGVYYFTGSDYGGVQIGVNVSGKNGTENNRITIQAYLNEVPILDGSMMTANARRCGMNLVNCSYYTLRGLTVRNVKEYGQYPGCPLSTSLSMSNCSFINLERCTSNGCGNGFSTSGFCNFINFLNCDACYNVDFSDNGGFANGFTLTMYLKPGEYASGTHVTLSGCRAWANSDDGFDMYGANGCFTYIDCWAWNNGWGGGGNGNGDGFKSEQFNAPEKGVQRSYIRCISFYNRGQGITAHISGTKNTGLHHLFNCVCYHNGTNGFAYGQGTNIPCILRNNISYLNRSNYGGLSNFIQDHNTWNWGVAISSADFVSLDTAGVSGARQPNGNLPDLSFLKLASGSDLIDAGVETGLPFAGNAPDIGAYEMSKDVRDSSRKSKISWLKLLLLLFCQW